MPTAGATSISILVSCIAVLAVLRRWSRKRLEPAPKAAPEVSEAAAASVRLHKAGLEIMQQAAARVLKEGPKGRAKSRAHELYSESSKRHFVPPPASVEKCAKALQAHTPAKPYHRRVSTANLVEAEESWAVPDGPLNSGVWVDSLPARRAWLLEAAQVPHAVCDELWVVFRSWVDEHVSPQGHGVFHAFVVARALGIDTSAHTQIWSGCVAGDLVVCMATDGLLKTGDPQSHTSAKAALLLFLKESLYCYNNRFRYAANRSFDGFSYKEQGEWQGGYDFIQIADPQLGMLHMDEDWSEELTMLRQAVQHANRLKPRFLLVSGDLTNVWPSEAARETLKSQIASFKDALRDLDLTIPIVMQPGNHDVGQNPRRADVERYRKNFGDDYFSFCVGGVFYLALNSQYYHKLCGNEEAAALKEEMAAWIEQQFRSEACQRARHAVVLSHVTPFMGHEDEAQGHFNWAVAPRKWFMRLAAEAGVRLVLCGHYHGNGEVMSEAGVEVVTTSAVGGVINWKLPAARLAPAETFNFMECVGDPPVVCDAYNSGMRLVRVSEDGIRHRFFELAHVPHHFDQAFDDNVASVHSHHRPTLDKIMGLPQTGATMHSIAFAGKLKSMSAKAKSQRSMSGEPSSLTGS